MIRITCSGCGSKLHAKQELAGQTRKCPKCGTSIRISAGQPAEDASSAASLDVDEAAPDEHVQSAAKTSLPAHHWPERLNRHHHYLICDRSKLAATWQNNGEGWLLKTSAGFISASRNHDQLPAQGDFRLVELRLETTEDGRRLVGIMVYQLAPRWALTALDKGDDQILSKIAGLGSLNKEQKNAVRNAIKDQFMHQVWEHADKVLDYLGNTDFHSPGPG
jgi:hypothetical protein